VTIDPTTGPDGNLTGRLNVPADATFVHVRATVQLLDVQPPDVSGPIRVQMLMFDATGQVDASVTDTIHPTTHYPLTYEVEHHRDGDGAAHWYSWAIRFWTGTNMPAAPDLTVFDVGPLTVRAIGIGPAVEPPPVEPPPAEVGAWPTAAELTAHLGGALPDDLAQRLVDTARAVVTPVVTIDPTTGPGPNVWAAALFIAADLYRAGVSLDGTYTPDGMFSVPASVSSNLVRKYGALLAPNVATGGMVG
jgi:hypothetical protein